ncbi:hypothetical protein BMS3Bbin09_01295 [bacterium BMS3Bbin09]|nr:hypothetical protein BMS3Bbin09_01295 [bacterium BMS3Bbin09]
MRISDLFEKILLINILLFFFLGGLFFISGTSWTHDGIIEHSDHKYIIRDAGLTGKGWITGKAKNAPDFKITVLTSTIQSVKTVMSEKLDNGSKAYEVLLDPGKYILAVDAEGYETLDIQDIEVRTGQDIELDLKFRKKQI